MLLKFLGEVVSCSGAGVSLYRYSVGICYGNLIGNDGIAFAGTESRACPAHSLSLKKLIPIFENKSTCMVSNTLLN